MEAMGQLTGGVAHDFNNLLAPIVGALDMLQRRGVAGEREQRLISGAMQSADRAKTLVQRLLAFARRQPLQPVPVDIAKLVSGMGDLVASTTGPQIKVVVSAPDDLPAACADPKQVEMALLNLSVNARDAMPDGGTLRITASDETVVAGHPSKLQPGAYIRLSVADTGAGVDEATLARAIEPFFSSKGIGKGTGLGLSMVHGLASQLGGSVVIQSQPGLGTDVELWLPRSAAQPSSETRSATTIDHLLISPSLKRRLKSAGVDRDVRGWEKASDHAPTWIELAARSPTQRPLDVSGKNKSGGCQATGLRSRREAPDRPVMGNPPWQKPPALPRPAVTSTTRSPPASLPSSRPY